MRLTANRSRPVAPGHCCSRMVQGPHAPHLVVDTAESGHQGGVQGHARRRAGQLDTGGSLAQLALRSGATGWKQPRVACERASEAGSGRGEWQRLTATCSRCEQAAAARRRPPGRRDIRPVHLPKTSGAEPGCCYAHKLVGLRLQCRAELGLHRQALQEASNVRHAAVNRTCRCHKLDVPPWTEAVPTSQNPAQHSAQQETGSQSRAPRSHECAGLGRP